MRIVVLLLFGPLALSAAGPVALAAAAAPAPTGARATAPRDEKILSALEAWLKAYRAGKIDFTSRAELGKESIGEKFGVLPKGFVGVLTAERELDLMLEAAVKLDNAAAAEVVLTVAAIGLDQGHFQYKTSMAPYAVRALAEKWLQQFKSDAANAFLVKAARGEARLDKTYGNGMRAAALRLLGQRHDASARPLLQDQLGAVEVPIRLAAAEALARIGDEAATEPLAAALDRETNDTVLGAIVQALRSCLARYVQAAPAPAAPAAAPKPDDKAAAEPPPAARLAVRAAIHALGRTTWRADMELVQFLGDFRTPETVPALIDVLQRFKDHPEEVQSGVLSGLLLHRAHETLVSMTGAVFPADAPDKWRELWERNKDHFQVLERHDTAKASGGTAAQSFCGIPVQGTRVLFIVDLSGSMNFPMKPPRGTTTTEQVPDKIEAPTRLHFAKQQLTAVINGLPEVSRLNFITFNGNPKAEAWSKDLLLANPKNKEKALAFVDKMRADGGTNMWAGLEEGLKMKSLVYGDRYATAVDEIFLVSDGAPSVGDVVDPLEILRLVTETNRFSKVRINTIFITSPNERDPRDLSLAPNELMRRMAEQNGGRFVEFKE